MPTEKEGFIPFGLECSEEIGLIEAPHENIEFQDFASRYRDQGLQDSRSSVATHRETTALAIFPVQTTIVRTSVWISAIVIFPLVAQLLYAARCRVASTLESHSHALLNAVWPVCICTGIALGVSIHILTFLYDWSQSTLSQLKESIEGHGTRYFLGLWAAPALIGPLRSDRWGVFTSLLASMIFTVLLVLVTWTPTWLYFNHMVIGYAKCHWDATLQNRTHASARGSPSEVLYHEYTCYRRKFEMYNADFSQRHMRSELSPWIHYLQESQQYFLAFEFITASIEQVPVFEVYGSIDACVLLVFYLICAWTTAQRERMVDGLQKGLQEGDFRNIEFQKVTLKEVVPRQGSTTPPHEDSISVSGYLNRLNGIAIWSGTDHSAKKARCTWILALLYAVCFATFHCLIPILCRPLHGTGTTPPVPHSMDRACAQVSGNLVLAVVLLILAYQLHCSTSRYSLHISQLFVFKAMWHPPSLDFILHSLVTADSARPSTSFRSQIEENVYAQLLDMSLLSQRTNFINSFSFVDLMAPNQNNLKAWWAIREYMLLNHAKERLNMEFLLIIATFYFFGCFFWIVIKLVQHDYTATNSMNAVMLWDVACLGILVNRGMHACLQMNTLFQEELVGLVEVRQGMFKLQSIALNSPHGYASSRLRIRTMSLTDCGTGSFTSDYSPSKSMPDKPKVTQRPEDILIAKIDKIEKLDKELMIDALLGHLKLVDERATLFGVRIDADLQLKLSGMVLGVCSSIVIKIMLTLCKQIF